MLAATGRRSLIGCCRTPSLGCRTLATQRRATAAPASSALLRTLSASSSSSSSSSSPTRVALAAYSPGQRHAPPPQLLSVARCLSTHRQPPPPPPPPPPPKGGSKGSKLAMLGTGAALLLGKGKYVLGALKLTKFASLGSMIFTVGTYSMFFGLPYAVGAVGLILVHETGHALTMIRLGIPTGPMVFLPFLGASVAMKRRPRDAYEEALVAFGGPYLGSAGALVVCAAAHASGSQLLFALADFGFMINLFNLLPIGMLDGGRICGALSPWAGVAGLGMGAGLLYTGAVANPIFYLIMLSGGWTTFSRFYYKNADVPPNYYAITQTQRAGITAGYFGLVAALIGVMGANAEFKKSPEVLIQEKEDMERVWNEEGFQDTSDDGTQGTESY